MSTEEIMSKLTDEERAALESEDEGAELISRSGVADTGDDLESDDGEDMQEQAEEGTELLTDEDAAAVSDDKPKDEVGDEAKTDEAAQAGEVTDGAAAVNTEGEAAKVAEAPIIADEPYRDPGFIVYKPKIDVAEKQAELTELEKAWNAGDVDDAEYNKKTREIEREIDKEELRKENAESFNQSILDRVESEYVADQTMFFKKSEEHNDFLVNDSKYAAFCRKLEGLIKAYPKASNMALFEAAKTSVEKDLGIIKAQAKVPEEKKEMPPKVAPKVPAAAAIGSMPRQAANDVGAGKFAKLNQLLQAGKTVEMEAELKKFTAEERDEWTRG